jgi:hypothetical protein
MAIVSDTSSAPIASRFFCVLHVDVLVERRRRLALVFAEIGTCREEAVHVGPNGDTHERSKGVAG